MARHSATTVAVQWEGGEVGEQRKHTREQLVSAVFGQFSSVLYPQQKDHKAVYET